MVKNKFVVHLIPKPQGLLCFHSSPALLWEGFLQDFGIWLQIHSATGALLRLALNRFSSSSQRFWIMFGFGILCKPVRFFHSKEGNPQPPAKI